MDGILNIDKPPGKTSYGVVAVIKRLSGEKHVGHAGTLDPDATGVLPVCLGRGTRIVEFLVDATKVYRAEIELGAATDTYDASGRVIRRGDASKIDRAQVESALEDFRGAIQQTPPMYSAVKHKGKPLYTLARAGIEVTRKSRTVKVHRLELLEWNHPAFTIEVECGKGTYIRSLANDLGQALGCGAYLKRLVRTRCGVFDIKDAVGMLKLEEAFRHGYWEQFMYPVDIVLQHFKAVVLDEDTEAAVRNGSPVALEKTAVEGRAKQKYCRAYAVDGRFLGILRYVPDKGIWQPKKVLV
ncbi:MAG: tRNA pseudouridine(55) synthase TruB [Dehalococcoidales bacterium]|nr:tRNA pseudouridine(55) synthase TruB [Dehalococcoidales bacterium]